MYINGFSAFAKDTIIICRTRLGDGCPCFISLHEIFRKCCILFNWNASLPLIQVKPTISSSLSNPGYFNSYEAQVLCKLEFICLIWMIMGSDLWAVVSIHSWNPAVRHLYRESIGQFSPFHAQTKRPADFWLYSWWPRRDSSKRTSKI